MFLKELIETRRIQGKYEQLGSTYARIRVKY